uniref:Uncharacterized protein n=1 Tax=Anguilla anguilla TaxID=7936 RepID=A0A0E9XYG1_ANGAN
MDVEVFVIDFMSCPIVQLTTQIKQSHLINTDLGGHGERDERQRK